MTNKDQVYAIILAGGAGTRFWPASRVDRPKQLLALAGAEPLLRQTSLRLLPLVGGWKNIQVATGEHLAAATLATVPELSAEQLLVEPSARNTAPCIAWAAAIHAPETILVVVPSDHHIADEPRFREVLAVAIESAKGGTITTIGLRPTHPETGFGYLELAEPARMGVAAPVRAFVEKPSRQRAEEFVASGQYLWNGGMFVFRAGDMVAAVRAQLPHLADGVDAFIAASRRGAEPAELSRLFEALPKVSIDYGVMEKLSEIAVVAGDFGWSDVGSWRSAWELSPRDDAGNSAPEGTVLIDARNNHVVDLRRAGVDPQVVALVGVEGLVVVATDDALLVGAIDRSQDVREVVAELLSRGDDGHV
jgi:mannose-1-phosphate guanylyltransferase